MEGKNKKKKREDFHSKLRSSVGVEAGNLIYSYVYAQDPRKKYLNLILLILYVANLPVE